jgi:hypothetical protein
MNDNRKMMQIVGAIPRAADGDKKSWWTKIGVAFFNSDGSINLKFDYLPADLANTSIQLREMDRKERALPQATE